MSDKRYWYYVSFVVTRQDGQHVFGSMELGQDAPWCHGDTDLIRADVVAGANARLAEMGQGAMPEVRIEQLVVLSIFPLAPKDAT